MNITAHIQKIALIAQVAGASAFSLGIILSAHHYAIGALFVTGAGLFVTGRKLRRA